MQNRTFFGLLRPIFAQKMKTAPHPPKGFGCRSCKGVALTRPEKPFEFPILAEKSVLISVKTFFYLFLEITCFWAEKPFECRKIRLNFGEDFFFEITCHWAEKPFEFPILAEKSVSVSDKQFESNSRAMKIRVKVAYSCLTLSKKPPLFEILATRLIGELHGSFALNN